MLNLLFAFALALPLQIPDRTQIQPPGAQRSLEAGFSVIGQLSFENGAEPAFVEVQLREPDGLNTLDRTTATLDGRFQFNGVGLGRYWIVIEDDHFQWVKQQFDVDTRSFAMIKLDVSLYPKPTLKDGTPIVSLEELRRDIPEDALKKLDEALREFRDDDADKGIERLEEALDIAPDFYEAHLELGYAHQRAGRREEAISSLERASELNTASTGATEWLGRLYFETENYPQAVEALLRRLELGNPSADDHFILGSSYYRLARPNEAEENLLRAVVLAPEEASGARLQLFNVYMRTRRPVQALEQVDAYLEAFPDHPNHAAMKERADQIRKALQNNR